MFKKLKAFIVSLFSPNKREGGLRSCRECDTLAAKQIHENIDRFRKEIREGQRTETGRRKQPYRPALQNIPRQVKPAPGKSPGWRGQGTPYDASFGIRPISRPHQNEVGAIDPATAVTMGYMLGSWPDVEYSPSPHRADSSSDTCDYHSSSSQSSSSSSSYDDSSSYDSGSSYSASSSCD